jgi:hypothetical protein
MIVVIRTWEIPHGDNPFAFDRRYLDACVPLVRRVPGLCRHVVLRGMATPGTTASPAGRADRCRGEDLWFRDLQDLRAALLSPEWETAEATGFLASVARTRSDLAEVVEEHVSSDGWAPGELPAGANILLRSRWDTPAREDAASIDEYYGAVHVPNVRRIPRLHRHVIMRASDSPLVPTAGWWRGADCWYDSQKDFAADQEAHERTRNDGFAALTTGIQYAYFGVAEEWLPTTDTQHT